MLWLDTVARCVREAMAERGLRLRDLVKTSGLVAQTVGSVLDAKDGTQASTIDAVVRAAGMQIVATCIPAGVGWESQYEQEIERLQHAAEQVGDVATRDAEELLKFCHYLITSGHASGALKALIDWRAHKPNGGEGTSNPLAKGH
jgi:hypothetical protein